MAQLIDNPVAYKMAVQALQAADHIYYNYPDDTTIPDSEYDELFDRVVAYEREHGADPTSPTQRVSGSATFAATKHAVPMLSLAKVTTFEDLDKFLQRLRETEYEALVIIEPKYDGASLSLVYEHGQLVQAITRGDGVTGDDVTANARLIRGVPSEIGEDFTGIVRGEVVITKADFLVANRLGQFANARNAAAGALRHSDPQEARRRRLSFLAYDLAGGDPEAIPLSFTMAHTKMVRLHQNTARDIHEAILAVLADRDVLPFEIDGVVIKAAQPAVRSTMGQASRTPNWAVAYKVQGAAVSTRLNGITWQVGTLGGVTPVAELEPVECMGVVISRASLHNPKYIIEGDITVGAMVDVTRAGDVIPYVVGLTEGVEQPDNEFVAWPKECPACGTALTVNGTSGQLKCPAALECYAQVASRLAHWASRDAADIDGLGTDIIAKLVDKSYLETPADFYHLEVEHFIDIGRTQEFGEKMLAAIDASRHLGMRRAIVGLAIPQVSLGTAKRLCEHYEGLGQLVAQATVETLQEIRDIGPIVAQSIDDWIEGPGSTLVGELEGSDVDLDRKPEDAPKVVTESTKRFVLTGSIEGYKNRKDFAAVLEGYGWIAQSSVGKQTDALVTDDADTNSGKAKKARDMGIEVITSAEALARASA